MMADVDIEIHCYCGSTEREVCMLQCEQCKRLFHIGCLKTGKPSVFEGDLFFTLICAGCSENREEECTRMKLQWLPVVMLALYNLQRINAGNRGYFRWKEQICSYIDKHWIQFFGYTRKKTTTWHGTVAGVLSSGCPQYFQSGTQELKESGWWRLTESKPPPLEVLSTGKSGSRKQRLEYFRDQTSPLKIEGLRSRAGKTSIQAAMELKAKRDSLAVSDDNRDNKRAKLSTPTTPNPKSAATSPVRSHCSDRLSLESISTSFKDDSASRDDLQLPSSVECTPLRSNSSFDLASDLADQSSQMSFSSTKSEHWFTARDLVAGEKLPECLLKGEDSDLEIDPCALSPVSSSLTSPTSHSKSQPHDPLPQMEDILAALESRTKSKHEFRVPIFQVPQTTQSVIHSGPVFTIIKQEPLSEDSSTTDHFTSLKHEHVSEDSNTFDSSFFTTQKPSSDCTTSTPTNMLFCLANNELKQQDESHGTPGITELKTETVGEVQEEEGESSEDEEDGQSPTSDMSDHGDVTEVEEIRAKEQEDQQREEEQRRENQRCMPMTIYEEKRLLKSLNQAYEQNGDSMSCELKRLRRKLIVRQTQREHNQKVFDIDSYMNKLYGCQPPHLLHHVSGSNPCLMAANPRGIPSSADDYRILDRFQSNHQAYYQTQFVSFLNRLVGTEDDQLQCIKSPYTARVLKPFIRRDYQSTPLKLRLLQEIKAYPHRHSTDWVADSAAPIDYCYVRPQHIPSVNSLCRDFFWPGIDLSECLQYPDFSCVVLYRKFVIGFAFMVPDVKYNEAYISFLFTHPEWRGAGIGTFMLYHLIQTCMGKDVTLHVSASNPAMMLYQKFGFKSEEFILDFYEKYFPEDAKDSRHAFFLRLRR